MLNNSLHGLKGSMQQGQQPGSTEIATSMLETVCSRLLLKLDCGMAVWGGSALKGINSLPQSPC